MLALEFVFLIFGLFLLLKGGDLLIVGAEKVSLRHGVSHMVIGLTVVAFGTSLPEFFVSFMANIQNQPAIGLGNVIGSNIANIGLVLGVGAVLSNLVFNNGCLKRDLPFVLFVSVIAYVMMLDGEISQVDGIIMIVLFIGYLSFVFYKAKKDKEDLLEDDIDLSSKQWQDVLYILIGIIGLYFGSTLTIKSATIIAKYFGVSDLVIGLTVVAIGTSLPELAATIQAIRKNKNDIGVGNIIGSNIFNILFVLGVNSTIKPFAVDPKNIMYWGPIMLFIAIILYPLVGKTKQLNKFSGCVLLLIYAIYLFLTYYLR